MCTSRINSSEGNYLSFRISWTTNLLCIIISKYSATKSFYLFFRYIFRKYSSQMLMSTFNYLSFFDLVYLAWYASFSCLLTVIDKQCHFYVKYRYYHHNNHQESKWVYFTFEFFFHFVERNNYYYNFDVILFFLNSSFSIYKIESNRLKC